MPRPAIVLAAVFVLAFGAGVAAFPHLAADPHNNDFTAYWAAGRLTLDGKNPYGAADLLALERTIGWRPEAPLMLWNPPWMLTVLMAFGGTDFATARSSWLVLQLALTLGCGIVLWRFDRGPQRWEPAAVVLTLLFAPLALSLKYGQIGPLCLLGLTGFLVLQERGRDFLAGAALSLASLKPHLVYMVWPAVLVWSVAAGRLKVLAGLITAALLLAIIPAVVNPHVYADYLAMVREPPPEELRRLFITNQDSPTFGWQLRLLFGKEYFKLQYVPTALGLLWLAWYGYRHRTSWNWADRLPVLLLASISTAAYGAWPADSLLLLPAVMAAAARVADRGDRSEVTLALSLFAGLTLLTHLIERGPTTEPYVWLPPLYLAAYLGFMRRSKFLTVSGVREVGQAKRVFQNDPLQYQQKQGGTGDGAAPTR